MSRKAHLIIVLAVASPAFVEAQTEGNTPGGEYYIHGIFNPTIADVRKIDLRPQAYDSIVPDRPMKYALLPVKGEVHARVDTIAPAKLNVLQPQPRLYKGFVKAGFGLYTTPLGELYYDQTRSRKNSYGLHVKHMSSNGGINDVGPSDYSFNNVDGFYKQFLPHHEVGGRLSYDRRRVSYYGYDPAGYSDSVLTSAASDDDIKRVYNDIGFSGRVKSLYRDSTKIAHDVGLEVHAYGSDADSKETNLKIDADLSKLDGSETYELGLLIDNNTYTGAATDLFPEFKQNGTLLGLLPGVSTSGSKYMVKIGVGMHLDAMKKTTFHFFPRADLTYRLFGDILMPYAGVDGARRRNSFRSLTRENPWLGPAPTLANSSLMYDVFGGLRGSVSSDLGFDVRVSKSRVKDRPLFLIDPMSTLENQYTIVYDRVDVLDISGELSYEADNGIRATGRIDIYSYDMYDQPEAWNLPPYQVSFGAQWSIRDKLILKGEAQFLGQRPAFAGTDTTGAVITQDLDGYLDLYLGAEYRYNKRLSVFLDVSNLSASKYERWFRYPVQRTLFLGGATYAF